MTENQFFPANVPFHDCLLCVSVGAQVDHPSPLQLSELQQPNKHTTMKHIVTAYNIVSESQENINALAEMTGIENPVLHLIEIHNTGDPIGWLVEKDEQGYITGPSI